MKQLIILIFIALSSTSYSKELNRELTAPNSYPYEDIFRYTKDISLVKTKNNEVTSCFIELKLASAVLSSEPQQLMNNSNQDLSVETCLPRQEAKRILKRIQDIK